MRQRIDWIDVAKGIGIIAVIMGHLGKLPPPVGQWIYSFHMPLFFVISGILFRDLPLRQLCRKKWNELIVPYMYTSLVIILLSGVSAFLKDERVWLTMRMWLLAALYGAGSAHPQVEIRYIGAIWFLLALFWCFLFLHFVLQRRYPLLWVLGLFLAGYMTRNMFWLPTSIQAGMCALAYVYIGYNVSKYRLMDRLIGVKAFLLSAVVWSVGIYFGCGKLYLVSNQFGLKHWDFLVSLFAVVCVCNGAHYLSRIPVLARILTFCGVNSRNILCIHIIEQNLLPWRALITGAGAKKIIFVLKVLLDTLVVWGLTRARPVERIMGIKKKWG